MANMDYQFAGFFSAATISAMHFQDVVMAIVLGFFGGLGGFLFKMLREKWLNRLK
jgi:H+/Cl- antiporter ClcA